MKNKNIKKNNKKYSLGDNIFSKNGKWSFSGETTKNFDSHITRSVPLYLEGHKIIKKISKFCLSKKSICYDVGCSTGSLLDKLAKDDKKTQFIGIDIEKNMIKFANSKKKFKNINFVCDDVMKYKFKKADLIISYYTAQFMNPKYRQDFYNKIYNSLNWGGMFILFEKIRGSDARFQEIYYNLYNEFKLSQGFTNSEIMNKEKSLIGVMNPFTERANHDFLTRAGFIDIEYVMKEICFSGLVAIK